MFTSSNIFYAYEVITTWCYETNMNDDCSSVLNYLFQLSTLQSVLVGLIAGYLVYYLIQRWRYKLPPTPFCWPVIGHLLELRKQNIYTLTENWSKDYGPVVTLKLGPISMLTLNRIDVVLEALVKRKADFAGRPSIYSLDIITEGGNDIVFGKYGPTWKLHRKLSSSALRSYMNGPRLKEHLNAALNIMIKTLSEHKEPVDPHPYNALLVFNVIAAMSFGQIYEEDNEQFKWMVHTFDKLNQGIGKGFFEDIFPPLRYWPTKRFKTILDDFDVFLDILKEKVSQHVSTFDPNNLRDFIDTLIAAQKDAEKEDPEQLAQITDVHIRQTVADIFSAGVDTTRYTLDWIILYCAKYPEQQQKAYEEIVNIIGTDRYPEPPDRAKSHFTVALIDEVIRLRPVAPLGVPHKALCDSTIGGYDIPKGTKFLINIWALHMDREQWTEPLKFNPDRFLENGKLTAKPESFLPFSAGRRVCLGEPLAKLNIFVMVASILQKFEIIAPEGETLDTEPRFGAVLIPKPFKVVYQPRTQGPA